MTDLQLVEAGRIGLGEPVTRYLPGFRLADPRGARITVRMFLLGSATLCAVVVVVARVTALVSGRQRPGREESGETTGVIAWGSESV